MKVLSKIDNFSKINKRERRVPDFYDANDIPELLSLYNEITTDNRKMCTKEEIKAFFVKLGNQQLESFVNSFEKDIEKIKDKVNYRYFKGSKDLIESFCITYDDDFLLVSGMYLNEKNISNKNEYLNVMTEDYFEFLETTIDFYLELDKFITSINKNKLITFMKMLE